MTERGRRATPATAPATTQPETPELRRLRGQIDRLDRRIVRLLNERAALGLAVGDAKRASGRRAVRDAARERRVLERVVGASSGPLPEQDLLAIYRIVIAAIRRLQHEARAAERSGDAAGTTEGGVARR